MKKRFKAIFGRVAALASALPFAISSLTFAASADEQYYRIGANLMYSYIGDTVQGYYLADDDTMKPITLSKSLWFQTTTYISGCNIDSPASSYLPNSYICWYMFSRPNDMKQSSSSVLPILQVDWNLHFSNVSFFANASLASVNTVYSTLNYSNLSLYNYFVVGDTVSDVQPLRPRASGDTNLAGSVSWARNDGDSFALSVVPSYYLGNLSDIYVGTAYYSNLAAPSGFGGNIFVGISCPVINPDFVFVGKASPPSDPDTPDTPSTNVSGSGSGTVSENSDNGYDFSYDINIDVPDYSSRLDDLESAINPSLDSSQSDIYNRFDSEGDEYNTLENSLLDNMASQIENMDSISFEFDPTYVEEAEDFTPLFNYPLVMWMTNLVLIISLISFLIFGKWV